MRLIIKRGSEDPVEDLFPHAEPKDRIYRLSVRSFGLSTLFHAALIVALYFSESLIAPPNQTLYESVIEPNKTKVIWYRNKSELPNIDSPNSTAKQSTRGAIRSPRILIADTKHGSRSEFVYQKSPVELPKEVKAPNLIALHAAEPAPPAPTPPAPVIPPTPAPALPKPLRAFVPPPATAAPRTQTAPAAPAMLPAPAIALPASHLTLPAAMPMRVADAPVSVQTAPMMLPAPIVKSAEASVALPSAPSAVPAAPVSRAGNLRPEAASNQPLGDLNVASINLDSAPSRTLPPGRRAGEFSTAPLTGEPGTTKGTGAPVPGLTTRGKNPGDSEIAMKVPRMNAPTPGSTITYREVMTHPMGSSLSAPLRPGSRLVPARVEQKFHDRPVYTMVIPAPRLPEYAADWIVWFSERVVPGQELVQIRAPVPEKKQIPMAAPPYTWGTQALVQISGVIDETGRVQEPAILQLPIGFPAQFVLAELATWRFKPATRNGVPIAVEVLLDIPFRQITSGLNP